MIIPLSGGGSSSYATISVTYPEGAICTCALGSKTLTAKNTDGKWVFGVPNSGSWVVQITSGSSTQSSTVIITTEGQVESLIINFPLTIFDSTNGLTDGYSVTSYCVLPAVDVTKYSKLTLTARITYVYMSDGTITFGLKPIANTDDVAFAASTYLKYSENSTNTITKTIDISSLEGEYFFAASDLMKVSQDTTYGLINSNSSAYTRWNISKIIFS